MNQIWVDMTKLYNELRRMRKSDISYVCLTLDEAEGSGDDYLPACLSLSGIKSSDPDFEIEGGLITAADITPPTKGGSEIDIDELL